MAEEIEVQAIPVEEGAGIDADNAEDAVIDFEPFHRPRGKPRGGGGSLPHRGSVVRFFKGAVGSQAPMRSLELCYSSGSPLGSVDFLIDFSWLSSMEEKLASASGPNSSPTFTIYRVPANIRKCDHAAYKPRIVSIGPFHRGRENLQAMEEHKWRYLHKVLAFGEGRNNLKKFLKKMMAIETQARNCYSQNIQMQARNCYSQNIQMSSKEFVEMMVLDGCFIIFLILEQIKLAPPDFLIDGNHWMRSLIKLDILLLENQLPFFVLECLWDLIGLPRATLTNGALNSFEDFFSYKLELKSPGEHVIHHLLHLLHLFFQPDSPTRKSQTTSASGKLSSHRLCQHIRKILRFLCPTYLINTYDRSRTLSKQSLPESQHESPQPWNMIPSATELQEAGVRFQLKQARSFFQVRFEQGLMEMSRLCFYDSTGILFRNFIAFEQCCPYVGDHFTSYCFFIDFLVNTPRDVSILREADIIRNALGSNEEVALLVNKLCKEISWDHYNNYLTDLFKEVNQHTQRRWPKWRAKLVRDYFSNPWAIISLIAGTIILFLTLLQTYFSVFAYFNPPKP